MAIYKIELSGLRFFGEHGLYEAEKLVGNEFIVDVSLEIKALKKKVSSIEETVNYVEVFRIIHEEIMIRNLFLETLAMDISEKIHEQFSNIKKISVRIVKLNPPINHFAGSVAVTYSKQFK